MDRKDVAAVLENIDKHAAKDANPWTVIPFIRRCVQ